MAFWLDSFNVGLWDLDNDFIDAAIYICNFCYYLNTCVETQSGLQQTSDMESFEWLVNNY